jgi:hypothetical protein
VKRAKVSKRIICVHARAAPKRVLDHVAVFCRHSIDQNAHSVISTILCTIANIDAVGVRTLTATDGTPCPAATPTPAAATAPVPSPPASAPVMPGIHSVLNLCKRVTPRSVLFAPSTRGVLNLHIAYQRIDLLELEFK